MFVRVIKGEIQSHAVAVKVRQGSRGSVQNICRTTVQKAAIKELVYYIYLGSVYIELVRRLISLRDKRELRLAATVIKY